MELDKIFEANIYIDDNGREFVFCGWIGYEGNCEAECQYLDTMEKFIVNYSPYDRHEVVGVWKYTHAIIERVNK